jgi:hypothetical protein
MAKPISKKIKRTLRKSARTVEKSIGNLKSGRKKPAGKSTVVAGAGVVVAAAAGVAVALHLLRKGLHNAATFHVMFNGDEGWTLRADGSGDAIQTFRNKAIAVRAARKAAADAAPSDLMIHKSDGTVQATHSYQLR